MSHLVRLPPLIEDYFIDGKVFKTKGYDPDEQTGFLVTAKFTKGVYLKKGPKKYTLLGICSMLLE